MLIKVGKLNFESQDRLSNLSSNFSRIRIEDVQQNIPRTENNPKAKMLKEKNIATMGEGIKRGRTRYILEKTVEEEKVS